MKGSVFSYDEGFEWVKTGRLWLDGKEVTRAIRFSEEEGWAERYVVDDQGNIYFNRAEDPMTPLTEVLKGHVVFEKPPE
jgi:hypothetical protein